MSIVAIWLHLTVAVACIRPLRGTKRTLFEGGVRGVGLIHGAGLLKTQSRMIPQGLVHAADWMPSVIAFLRSLPGLFALPVPLHLVEERLNGQLATRAMFAVSIHSYLRAQRRCSWAR